MTVFKTLDARGQSFFDALDAANKAFKGMKINGILEVIFDPKKNFTEAFKNWAKTQGYKTSREDEDSLMVRLFIKKASKAN